MHQFRSIVYLFVAIINVIGTWFAMQIWGAAGAALMTGAATIIGHGLLMNWYYQARVGLDVSRFWKEIGKTFATPIFLCTITVWLGKNGLFYTMPMLLAGIIIYTCVFCLLSWFFTMNPYEKSVIKEFCAVITKIMFWWK